MVTSIKPINIILVDTYFLGLLYLFITWQYINCNTNSNIWELFYYLVLLLRLVIDELENNNKISKTVYTVLIFISSFIVLLGMCTYEVVIIARNSQDFDDPDHKSSCFQNRIFLVGQCVIGFAICVKDVLVYLYDKSKQELETTK
jgi:hypothetical protein